MLKRKNNVKKALYSAVLATLCLLLSFPTLVWGASTIQAQGNPVKIGAWLGAAPNESRISQFQQLQGKKLDIVHLFINWSTNYDAITQEINSTYANNSIMMITWEAWGMSTVDIKDGKADNYVTNMANSLKGFGKEIWLRPLHEGNGNWYPWCIGDSTVNTNDTYKAAFKHIVDIFRRQGATNVKWVFGINNNSVGSNATLLGHYPGNEYVDYTSIDGYNWGTTQSWGSKWENFDQIFSTSYNALVPLNKPIIIGEWASTEVGGSKSSWITESFSKIYQNYKQICALIWFNENKETDWRVESSSASLEAYKKAISGSSPTIIYGDIDLDGSVTALDFAALKKHLLGSSVISDPTALKAADVDGDGTLSSLDLSNIKMYLLGIIAKLPV